MTTDGARLVQAAQASQQHAACFVCGPANVRGLGMHFRADGDDGVRAEFPCAKFLEGYPGIIHGGILCSLLDGAMLHCLFARGLCGVTAELRVQFRHPVDADVPATVRARLVDSTPPVYTLRAELVQAGRVKVRGTGRFVEASGGSNGSSCDE